MLVNKFLYTSNVSSNSMEMSSRSSVLPNTLFSLLKNNILIISNPIVVCDNVSEQTEIKSQNELPTA